MKYDIKLFKQELKHFFKQYEIEYRHFPEGDFGELQEVVFENKFKVGAIQFWGMDYLAIQLFDYQTQEMLINIIFEPDQDAQKEKGLQNLVNLI
ncbi:hypothetical protein [Parafilimonas terrae]|uniref:Uncharacterized protein n=1 Tax=Parafilimonas terrae TaxID=1465490 RepID=A0A1I5WUT2_9BACT|nr:hypothetical protein [Parafilimonas terrae]SFQ23450.1 hypothetical protein SAMN05444277_10715 [Parafilimonas terrae]